MKRTPATIAPTVRIKGEVSSTEDLTIEGQVDGRIELGRNVLTIAPSGRTDAHVRAEVVDVMGRVDGFINATDSITIRESAVVDGALAAPRVGIEEGACFPGHIDINVTIPLKKVIKRLRPEKPTARFLRRLVVGSFAALRHDANPGPLFGVLPKVAEASLRLQVEGESSGAVSKESAS